MRFCKFVLSLLLLPPVCLVGWETGRMVWGVLGHFQTAAGFFLGAVVYAAIHYGCYNFSRPYVLVHEMTHALAALLCGSRVKDFSVKKESGYVKLDKANMFIMLAPYFIPGYVIA
ncbi:MAG: site-2 protease family protein, partial [Elusimicrobiaceae bacterium]|nr:site-2 protease family protein [Elusimicrobiaceae bacterium]